MEPWCCFLRVSKESTSLWWKLTLIFDADCNELAASKQRPQAISWRLGQSIGKSPVIHQGNRSGNCHGQASRFHLEKWSILFVLKFTRLGRHHRRFFYNEGLRGILIKRNLNKSLQKQWRIERQRRRTVMAKGKAKWKTCFCRNSRKQSRTISKKNIKNPYESRDRECHSRNGGWAIRLERAPKTRTPSIEINWLYFLMRNTVVDNLETGQGQRETVRIWSDFPVQKQKWTNPYDWADSSINQIDWSNQVSMPSLRSCNELAAGKIKFPKKNSITIFFFTFNESPNDWVSTNTTKKKKEPIRWDPVKLGEHEFN